MSTTLSTADATAEAHRLDEAERTRTQIPRTSLIHPEMTIDDAYMIQAEWLRLKLDRGERLVGHKIGLTSRAMQDAMQIATPDSGFLTDAMVFDAGSTLRSADFCDPKVEVELAFVLRRDLVGTDVTVEEVLGATEYVTPAVELIDARSFRTDPQTGEARTVLDTISDNAADAGIVVGGARVDPIEVDLRWIAALAYRNDIIEETGVAAGVLDHPAMGIVWLAQRYADHDLRLAAGQTILSGSFTRPIDVRAGDRFRFDFGPLGTFGLNVA